MSEGQPSTVRTCRPASMYNAYAIVRVARLVLARHQLTADGTCVACNRLCGDWEFAFDVCELFDNWPKEIQEAAHDA